MSVGVFLVAAAVIVGGGVMVVVYRVIRRLPQDTHRSKEDKHAG